MAARRTARIAWGGGEGNDWLFGGGDEDRINGDAGNDYADGGAGSDTVNGGPDDDIVRGGANDDVLHGDTDLDQLYGDDGRDYLYGDAGTSGSQAGQRLFGGLGIDFLYAFASTTNPAVEQSLAGDEMHGGPGGDFLYGNLRQDLLFGDSGKDFLHGDYLAGPTYAFNPLADRSGASDCLFGGSGEDQLLGGGGDDTLMGGSDSDRLEGQDGSDTLLGGEGIDILVLDVDADYSKLGGEVFDGHFGNLVRNDVPDDNATDILLIEGTNQPDLIRLSQTATGQLKVEYTDNRPPRDILATWRDAADRPLVEQFSIAGLGGNGLIEFVDGPTALDVAGLIARSDDFIGVIDGGPGRDILRGTGGRDRLDGGEGSDELFGMGGDDRLWGDGGFGAPTDHDRLFGGQGNDDLLGGQGTNELFAWSRDPLPAGDTQFGVFVDKANQLHDTDGDLDNDGVVDNREDLDGNDQPDPAYFIEDTGLNRALGSPNDDSLFGGTGLDFLYGNGGNDTLYRADGSKFDSLDDGLGGDEWKQYAKQTGNVWYYSGSNLDDVITVDFVTEPGLLEKHHLITRLTNNNNNFTFNAQVQLDFNATDAAGNRIWDPQDLLFDLATREMFQPRDLARLLPPEGDFLAIIVDALQGNDRITVGPTVTKSVWIDAGPGDDRVEIASGQPVLPDATEQPGRNDLPEHAFDLGTLTDNTSYTGLTIDSPQDEDWYRFQLGFAPQPGDRLTVTGLSKQDGLAAEIRDLADNVIQPFNNADAITGLVRLDLSTARLQSGTAYRLHVRSNQNPTVYALDFGLLSTPDGAESNDTQAAAHDLENLANVSHISGLSLHTAGDIDWFKFALVTGGTLTDQLQIIRSGLGPLPALQITDQSGAVLKTALAGKILDLSVLQAAQQYFIKVSGTAATRYELLASIGQGRSDSLDLAQRQLRNVSNLTLILRRDVILGGAGNDVLSGGSGEEWIFGGPDNDVLTGGLDRQASDLLFGEGGEDIFQLVPDKLPLIKGTERTLIPTLSDRFDGGPGDHDQVLFLGGDLDNRDRPVPDSVALRYNTQLHRYEFTALIWDPDNQQFVRASIKDPYEQEFIFYQTLNVEQTVIDTRAGDDEVHANPGFKFPNTDTEYGIAPGDFEQRALIAALDIRGGDGYDRLFGGALDDIIDGGSGADFMVGGEGNDRIIGNDGDDLLAGDGSTPAIDSSTTPPDRFEFPTVNGVSGRNDDFRFAADLGVISPGTVIDGLTLNLGDTGDWYLIRTPEALRQFGSAHSAYLNLDWVQIELPPAALGSYTLRFVPPLGQSIDVSPQGQCTV